MAQAYTKRQQMEEIVKCGRDPIYFINEYVKIQHPLKGTIPFDTYPFQEDCIRDFEQFRFNIVLKSRQLGLSTIAAAYAVWLAIFHKDKNILVIATKLPTAQNFIKKVIVMLYALPKWLLMPKFEDSKQQVSFNNGSQIKAIPTSEDAGRSEALSLLVVDEAAFIRGFEDIWTGLYPTVSTGGRVIIMSTPNGVGGQYYKLWTESEAKVNEFNAIRLPWTVHPEHDEEWFKQQCRNLSKRKIAQELLCDFISSGDTFLQPDDIEAVRQAIQRPMEESSEHRGLWTWRNPEPGHSYVISADVARGDAGDFSTFHVIDREGLDVVAEYMAKISPDKFADVLSDIGKKYNTAYIAVENNTFGYFTNVKLRDTGYKRLFYQNRPMDYIPLNPNELPGFSTQAKNRSQILTKLEELFRNRKLHTFSQRLHDQLQAFVWNGSRPAASKDAHDDLIMALAIGAWIVGDGDGPNEQAQAMAYAMLAATGVTSRNTSAMPANQVQPLVNPMIRGFNPYNVHRARDASQVQLPDGVDFSWLNR